MKITIIIEMESTPQVEVVRSEPPLHEERTQTTLEAFKQPTVRLGSSRIGAPTYAQGRATHHCSACGSPNRRKDPQTGVCKEDACV